MATIVFPPFPEKRSVYKRWAYASILKDIVRGCSDSIDALTLFRELLRGEDESSDSLGFMAFDAHVGDTACHIRASMIKEIFSVYQRRKPDPRTMDMKSLDWIDCYLERLERLQCSAKDACVRLTRKRQLPDALGFGEKNDSVEGILRALGWKECTGGPLCSVRRSSLGSAMLSSVDLQCKFHGHPKPSAEFESTLHEAAQIALGTHPIKEFRAERSQFKNLQRQEKSIASPPDQGDKKLFRSLVSNGPGGPDPKEQIFDVGSVDSLGTSDNSRDSASSVSSISETLWDDEPSGLSTEWRVGNPSTLVRFLVYSYILSKYKRFSRLERTVSARVCPELAMQVGERLIEPYLDHENKEYRHTSISRYISEFATYQAWLSDLSCSWLYSLATASISGPSLASLMAGSIQRDAQGVVAMACYPGWLVLREHWSRECCKVVLVDRYFCPRGHHLNLYIAELSQAKPVKDAAFCPLGQQVDWLLQPVAISDLLSPAEQYMPHLVFMGNSIDGSHEDYLKHIPCSDGERHQASYRHPDASCAHNIEHRKLFALADHDRLTLAIFSGQTSYPFPLQSGMRERDFLEMCIDTSDAQEVGLQGGKLPLKQSWRTSSNEGDSLGVGCENMRIFAIQHVALETKARIAKLIQAAESQELLLPLQANVKI